MVLEISKRVVEVETKQTWVLTNDGGGDNVEDVIVGFLGNSVSSVAQDVMWRMNHLPAVSNGHKAASAT